VIFHAVDTVEMAIFVFKEAIHVGIQAAFIFQNHGWLSFVDAINNVIDQLGVCAHDI
jgi:hypothetical protein